MADSGPVADRVVPGTGVGGPPDPFRWLEDPGSPRTRSWLAAQQALLDRHTRRQHASEAAWRRFLTEVETSAAGRPLAPPVEAGGMLFRHELTEDGGELLSSTGVGSRPHVLLNTSGHPSVSRLVGWQPDPTGRVVAAQLHHDGHENGGLHILPVGRGEEPRQLSDASPHPAVAFLDGLLLYSSGTRTEHALQAHHLGDGSTRTVQLPVAGPVRLSLHVGAEGHLLLRTRFPGTSSARWWCTRWTGRGAPDWQPLPLEDLSVTAIALGTDEVYVVVDHRDLFVLDLSRAAGGDVASPIPLASPSGPKTAPAADIRALRMLGSRTDPHLAVLRQSGTMRRLDVRRVRGAAGVPAHTEADEAGDLGFTWHARLRLGPTSYDRDGHPGDSLWFLADDPQYGALSHRVTARTPIGTASRRSTLRTMTATSRDGTAFPITICDPPTRTRHEPAPTLVTVYGGFGVPLEPSWDPIFAGWLAAGGRIAWVHARGGGEFGPDWAAAGRGPGKSDTVDDLCAAARALQAEGETRQGQLAALAASNGGLILSAALVRAPRLFSAVACSAPLTDMARYHVGGLGKLWCEEYGDPTDPEALRALLTYSPYHHVRGRDAYPAVLFITGGNDARVRPWHAWKLCAALQETTCGTSPILLDHQENTGHYGRAGDDARSLSARVLALLAARTGLAAPPVGQPSVPAPPTRSAT
ncbi:prolyl oligopeptidase family serine peptidase [Streptomyces sp. NPDC001508]|uniref:prolyl oligopeptidase family serine peptidase n=1 Tax=Streptomyces sp. NPDC001508 TaxID=3154656 RepID=UPI0033278A61